METLTVNKNAMKKYIVVHDFTIGQADLPVRVGDELWYTKGLLEIYGQSYRVNNLHVAYRPLKNGRSWLELAPGQEPDPVMERLAGRDVPRVPRTAQVPQQRVPQNVAQPAPYIEEGIEAVNGIEVLPDNWADMHWTHKRAYVVKMRDAGLLADILEDESEKMQKIIKERIEALKNNAPSPFSHNSLAINSDSVGRDYGTPVHMQKPQLQVTQDNVVIPTNFGDTTDYIDMTKSGKSNSEDLSFDVSVTTDSDNMSDFAFDT